jgi:hypothetical protein
MENTKQEYIIIIIIIITEANSTTFVQTRRPKYNSNVLPPPYKIMGNALQSSMKKQKR